jgi:hypothetical protein
MRINPLKGVVLRDELTDNWGYDYNAYLTVAMVDNHRPFRTAVRFRLRIAVSHERSDRSKEKQ